MVASRWLRPGDYLENVQGGLPIIVDGQVIGGIGASFDTPEHDVQVAQAGLAAAQALTRHESAATTIHLRSKCSTAMTASLTIDDPTIPLLYALRDDLQALARPSRFGCGLGQCGACTVLLDRQRHALPWRTPRRQRRSATAS